MENLVDDDDEGESVFTFSVNDDSEAEETKAEEESVFTFSVDDDAEQNTSEGECELTDNAQCVDECCPSLQVNETGETYLHVPPAAIASTLGGIFSIVLMLKHLRLRLFMP